jgi:hypothetical protein
MRFRLVVLLALAALGVQGCASKRATINDRVPPAWLSQLSGQPLAVEDVQASHSDGTHAIFFKLSRFPESVTHADSADGMPRISIDLGGPQAEDLPQEQITLADSLVHTVMISRSGGTVHLVMDLSGDRVPPYSVHEMADWIMVRLTPQ